MGIYNFQERFVPFILSGAKTHTIRAIRKYPDKPGNMLHLYTGLRHPGARLLMRAKCLRTESISIRKCFGFYYVLAVKPYPWIEVCINNRMLSPDERDSLARRDGFLDWTDMLEFWKARLPFYSQIVHWEFSGVLKGSLGKRKLRVENKGKARG